MRFTKKLLLASILLVAFVSLQLGVLGFSTHGSFGGSTRRSKANYSWKLDATRKISNDNATTKVLYQKVVRPSANLPDILFLGYLVEYLESHFKLPNNLSMVYEPLPCTEESRSILAFDSPLSPNAEATRMEVEVVGIYTDKKEETKSANSVPNMAMVVVKKAKSPTAAIPPMMENLFKDSEKKIIKSLDRGLEDFIAGKIRFQDEGKQERKPQNVKNAQEAIDAEIVDAIPTPKASKVAAEDIVFETIATSDDDNAQKAAAAAVAAAAMDTMKVKATPVKKSKDDSSKPKGQDFAVEAAKKMVTQKKSKATKGETSKGEDFAVAAARKAAAKLKTNKKAKNGKRKPTKVKVVQQETKPLTPEQSFKVPDYMGEARSFRTTISRPKDRVKRKQSKAHDTKKTKAPKGSTKAKPAPSLETTKAETKPKSKVPTPSREQIERDIMKAAEQVMDEITEDSEDMTAEQLLQEVLKFDEKETKENAPGSGFVSGAFEKAKELMQERYQQRQDRLGYSYKETETLTGIRPDIVDPNEFPVEESKELSAEEELKKMFEAGERIADGRITKSTKESVAMDFAEGTTEADVDSLIAKEKSISSYAKVLDDELVELELSINKSPDEEFDGPRKNPIFDIMSGPEVYNPNVELNTVNYPGALPGTKEVRLPKDLKEAIKQAEFAASVLSKMETVETKDVSGETTKVQYFTGKREMTKEQVNNLQSVVKEASDIGIIRDPLTIMAERSRLQMIVDELWNQPNERFQDIASSYKDLILSDNFVMLVKERMTSMADRDLDALRREDESLKEPHEREREILGQLVAYAQLLLKEARALGAELEAQQLEVVRSICKVAMDPSHTTEEETAMALTDAVRDMRPLLDDVFVAYLKYAVAEEEARLARAGLLDDPEHNQWLFVLQIVQQGVYAEIAKGINRYIDHIGYVLRMETPRQRRMLLKQLIDVMPTMDVRPFVQVVDNIVGSLGDGSQGDFDGVDTLGGMTNQLLQLRRDVQDFLPPEQIALKSKDADEWAAKQRKRLMESRKITKQRLQAAKDTAHLDDEIEALGRRGEIERIE